MNSASSQTPSPDQCDLRRARAELRNDMRGSILNAAAAILRQDGPAAVTIRAVAIAVNASTKVIYTAFGGKNGLLDALYLHSFAGLERELDAQRQVDPAAARLRAMCNVYRAYAKAEPAFYTVMLGDLGRDYEAPSASRQQAAATFRIVRDTIAACIPRSRINEADVATRHLWAAMHGVVSLEQRKLLGNIDQCNLLFEQAVTAACSSYDIASPPGELDDSFVNVPIRAPQ